MSFNIVETSSTLEFETYYPQIRQDVLNGMKIKDVMAKHDLTQGKWIKYRRELMNEGIIKRRKNVLREAKHYYFHSKSNKWVVQKQMNGKKIFFGKYDTEETAQRIVKELKQCDWDKNQLQEIQKRIL